MRPAVLLLLAGTALLSQDARYTASFTRPDRPRTLKQYLQSSLQPDALLLLEDVAGAALSLQGVLRDEPLCEWGLQVRVWSADDPVQKELRQREGWPDGPRWVQLDPDGRVRATGTFPTTARSVADRLRESGFRSRAELLQEFLRRNPERADAWLSLFQLQWERAERLMQPRLKPRDTKEGAANPAGPPELLQPLGELDDERIFGPMAAALHGLLGVEGWGEAGQSWMAHESLAEIHSKVLREEARIQLPKVESFLRRRPGHWQAWMLWTFLFPLTDGEPTALLEEVVAVPGASAGLPASFVYGPILRQLQRLERWTSLKKAAAPQWERFRQETVVLERKGSIRLFDWQQIFVPLLEAHLRLGERARADELVRQALEWSPPARDWLQIVRMARRCGEEGLAQSWERQAPNAEAKP